MKKTTIPISFDEEKAAALKLYLEQKGMKMEDELAKSVEALYMKTVPAGVRDFIDLRSGNASEVTGNKMKKGKPQDAKTQELKKPQEDHPQM